MEGIIGIAIFLYIALKVRDMIKQHNEMWRAYTYSNVVRTETVVPFPRRRA